MTDALIRFLPTNAWVRAAIVPVLVFIAMAADRSYLADFWHHLARGRVIVEEGRILDRDIFTFTVPGRSFQDVNWLTQVLYYQTFAWGGLDLVRLVNAAALALALGWLVILCRRKSGSLPVAAAVGIVVFFGLWQILTVRPQTFSLLLFVILYDLLDRSARRPWLLCLAPLILALWANLHGAFPAGIMLIGCFALEAAWQGWKEGRLLRFPATWWLGFCLVASLAATLINPYGWRIYQYVGLTSNIAAARRIDEWVPPTLDLWIGKAWLASMLGMAGLFAAGWFKLGRKPAARDVILIAFFVPLACGSVRMVAWWLLICAPSAAVMISAIMPRLKCPREGTPPSRDAAVVFVLMLVLAVFSVPGLQRWNPLLAARLAAPRVEDDLERVHRRLASYVAEGRIFSRFEWGEYLTWSLAPQYKVFMDGRIEIYPDDVWNQYAAVTRGLPEWEKILDDRRVDALLLDADYHGRTGLLPRVEAAGGWERVFEAGSALLYLRRNAGAIAKSRILEP
jgi:hypothetical protein